MPILGSFAGISSKAYGLTSNLVGDYFFIAKSDAPTAAVASLDFSSIPQNFTHLEIRMIVQNSATLNQGIRMRFNGDSGATQYSQVYSYYDQTNNTTTNTTGQSSGYAGEHTTTASGNACMSVVQIQNYANTNIFKNYTAYNYKYGGTQYMAVIAGNYKSGSAISSISIFPGASNFVQYSVAYLYGIK